MKKKIIIIISMIALIFLVVLGGYLIMNNNDNNKNNIINNDNSYNLKLIKTVNINKKENYLISPYSIEIALNLLKEGSSGNTLREIEDLIGNRKINNVAIKDRIGIANAAFIMNKYKNAVEEDFTKSIRTKYNSDVLYDDYKTPKVINDWVNEKTFGMIDKILDDINKDFVLGLANALAIDVEWANEFECTATTSEKFTKDNGSTYDVEMMHASLKYDESKYLSSDDATGVIIPYKKYNDKGESVFKDGRRLEFVAILPHDNLHDYINNLTEDKLKELDNSAKEVDDTFEIRLALPRFRYDYELKDFKEVLMNLGIKDAFDKENADFTRIVPKSTRSDIINLYVGEAIHKTHIDLNEKGTKAAAVTYFGMFSATAMPDKREIVKIDFNRPFMYIIRDSETKEMLFFGTVYEPNKWTGSTCLEEVNK